MLPCHAVDTEETEETRIIIVTLCRLQESRRIFELVLQSSPIAIIRASPRRRQNQPCAISPSKCDTQQKKKEKKSWPIDPIAMQCFENPLADLV